VLSPKRTVVLSAVPDPNLAGDIVPLVIIFALIGVNKVPVLSTTVVPLTKIGDISFII
jgi:hypothetical protein